MQFSLPTFTLAVLVAVLVASVDARASNSRDDLLNEITDNLLLSLLENRNIEKGENSINGLSAGTDKRYGGRYGYGGGRYGNGYGGRYGNGNNVNGVGNNVNNGGNQASVGGDVSGTVSGNNGMVGKK